MRITTWNVLHRIHAVNWKEAPVATYVDERVRITGIAGTIARWLDEGVDVVCLQEVSGDQLAALREHVASTVAVLHHRLARVPRLRAEGPAELTEPGEHLVVVVRDGGRTRVRSGHTFDSDPGKGMLAVDVGDVIVVSTHVSFGERGTTQLARLAVEGHDEPRTAIVAGDFNAPTDVVQRAFGDTFVLAKVVRATRIATNEAPAKVIDHVAVRAGTIATVEVLDAAGLSDHLPVAADVLLDAR